MPIEGSASPIVIEHAVEGAVAVLSDIREQIRAEEMLEGELSKSANELGQTRADLRALSAYLMIAQEQERRRLARELHDDFGQRMSVLTMNVDRALQQIHADPRESEDLLRRIHEELSTANDGLREVSHRLHPAVIEDLGLIAALKSLTATSRENGSEVTCWLPDQIPDLSLDTATALYRIAQEALRNAQTHGKGAPVHLTLTTQDGHLNLKIHDNGPGFSLTNARLNGGLGLLSMQERARLVNGTLQIKSQPGDGTVVSVSVPV
jgi:signal transduction histidine kinase